MNGFGVPAPKPDNLDAMSDAYASGDPVAIAREKAAYNRQLIAAGLPPLYDEIDAPDITRPTRGDDR